MRVIYLKDAVRYQSTKSGGKQCTTEEYGNAEAKLSSGIEQSQVEHSPRKKPSFKATAKILISSVAYERVSGGLQKGL